MKIAILNFRNIGHPKKGGAELYLEKLCAEWIDQGHEIRFFSPKHKSSDHSTYNKDIEYIQIGNKFTSYYLIRRKIKNYQFDLIIDSVNVRGFNTPKIRWPQEYVPVVLTIIYQTAEEVWDSQARFPFSWLGKHFLEPYWLGIYKNSNVITISESSMESLKQFGLKKISVVYPGVAANSRRTNQLKILYPKKVALVFCARLVSMKRPLDALEILKYLQQMNLEHEFKLTVVGSGPLLTKMTEMAIKENLPVEFLGFVDDDTRDEIFKSADFHLATSVREGWGMTVTEAACQGCLTIGYDVPGLRDSVRAANGLLSPADPKSAAEVITNLLQEKVFIQVTERGGLLPWREVARTILAYSDSDA